jgi:hypothetical protein
MKITLPEVDDYDDIDAADSQKTFRIKTPSVLPLELKSMNRQLERILAKTKESPVTSTHGGRESKRLSMPAIPRSLNVSRAKEPLISKDDIEMMLGSSVYASKSSAPLSKSAGVSPDKRILAELKRKEEEQRKRIEQEFDRKEQQQLATIKKLSDERLEKERLIKEKEERKRKEKEALEAERLKKEELVKQQKEQEVLLKKQEEQKAKEEAERKKKEEAALLKPAESPVLNTPTVSQASEVQLYGDYADYEQNYLPLVQYVKSMKENVTAKVKANKEMYMEAMRYRMPFQQKLGAVTHSKQHIVNFSNELVDILQKAYNLSKDLLYLYVCNTIGKIVASQAESEVSVNLAKSYPLAKLVVLLLVQCKQKIGQDAYDVLQKCITGRLVKKCMYVVPIFAKRIKGETDDQYRVKMGYKQMSGSVESEDRYTERMCGMFALHVCLLSIDVKDFGCENCLDTSLLWSVFAKLLNLKPRKISSSLIETFLKVSGSTWLQRYGQQAEKILLYLRQDYLSKLRQDAAKVRVELILDEYEKSRVGGFGSIAKGSLKELEGASMRP